MSNELKPCPFCGGVNLNTISTDSKDWIVFCFTCGARGPANNLNELEASKEWNEIRMDLQSDHAAALEAENARLRRALDLISTYSDIVNVKAIADSALNPKEVKP